MSVSPIIPPPPREIPIMPIIPILSGCSEEYDWEAVEDFEDSVYTAVEEDDSISDDQYDEWVCAIRAAYDEYYRLYES